MQNLMFPLELYQLKIMLDKLKFCLKEQLTGIKVYQKCQKKWQRNTHLIIFHKCKDKRLQRYD